MHVIHELLMTQSVTPYTYLRQMLDLYPYDIEEALVFSLLKNDPKPHPSLLSFIEYMRHVHKYLIQSDDIEHLDLEKFYERICIVSQRNKMVLHTHQFYFDASLHACAYPIHNPYAHLPLQQILFIDQVHLHLPISIDVCTPSKDISITESEHFLYRDISLNANDYFALSIQIADQHGIVFLPRTHVGLLCACSSLYQICKPTSHHDFFLIYALSSTTETQSYYYDATNELYIGLVSEPQPYPHFSLLKDMISTLYNAICVKKHDCPIHATMISLQFPQKEIGVLLCGEEKSGKSEIVDALLQLCDTQAIPYHKICDDQATLHALDNDVYVTGTEIGAYIHADALPRHRIFQTLSSSVIVKEQNTATHFLTPFTTHEETCQFHKVDVCIYLDNTSKTCGYQEINTLEVAYQVFDTLAKDQIQRKYLHEFIELMFLKDITISMVSTRCTYATKEAAYMRFAKQLYATLLEA